MDGRPSEEGGFMVTASAEEAKLGVERGLLAAKTKDKEVQTARSRR